MKQDRMFVKMYVNDKAFFVMKLLGKGSGIPDGIPCLNIPFPGLVLPFSERFTQMVENLQQKAEI